MKRHILFVFALLATLLLSAQVKDDTLRVTGIAKDYRAAVNEALVSALEQHDGITVDTSELQTMTHDNSSVATRVNGVLDDRAKLEMDDSIKKNMQKWAKGKIAGYTVVSDALENGRYRVVVDVRFPGRYVVGRDPNALRRMAVSPFRPHRETFSLFGQPVSAASWAAELANQLNVQLTQTRKFTMLDRAFDADVNAELARLGQANSAPQDVVRLNQKLGTDYLVTGEIAFTDVLPPPVNPLTGQVLPRGPALFASVTYRVILAPTGQLKWTDTVRLDAADCPAGDAHSFIGMTAEAAAREICSGMLQNILPFEVAAISRTGQLVIGEGGKRLTPGQRFTVFAIGDEVTDTRTGEVIDVMEEPVGTAEITYVQEKLSYARLIEGDAKMVAVGARLRPVPMPKAQPQAPAPVTTIQGNGGTGVVTPF